MKVIIDDKIPYINKVAEALFGEVVYMPGADFGQSRELTDADALIIRTRTKCNRQLLADTNVKFIATATIGYDHINADDLAQLGIRWTNCPGCNAASVGQYVRNSLLVVARQRGVDISDFTVGIVGYGHVGKAVARALEEAGCTLLYNDPPLQAAGDRSVSWSSIVELAAECDAITFHTPLTHSGLFATHYLADAALFDSLKRKPIIINAARGGVVDERALLKAYADGKVSQLVIDTWENEPLINSELLDKALIATPHIAGYSADGKSNATRMALMAVCRHFNIGIADEAAFLAATAAPPLPVDIQPVGDMVADALALYNPLADTARLKDSPATFEQQRGNYPLRRESF